PAVCQALLAEGAHDPALLRSRTKVAVVLIGVILAAPLAAFIALGRPLLGLFGPAYAAGGAGVLVLLAVAALPDAATNVIVSRSRVEERLWPAAAINAVIGGVACSGAWMLLPRLGVVGGGVAWLGAQCAGVAAGVAIAAARRFQLRRRTGAGTFALAPVEAQP